MGPLHLFLPEATVLAGALLAFLMSIFAAPQRVAWGSAVVMALASVVMSAVYLFETGEPFFEGIYRVDALSQLLKLGITVGLLLTLLASGGLESFRKRARIDVPVFLMFSALGMMALVSATEMLTLYVSLELSAYGLYILAALHKMQRAGSEAAAKYILFGAASSAVTLYGVSLIYGVAQSTYLSAIVETPMSPLFAVGILLALAGILFKLAIFPFHAWAPDAYQGSPHESATFIGTASKVAAVGVMIRLILLAVPDTTQITTILLVLCVASMTVGNLAAIAQNDLKRLIAYSTVAHGGYLLIGLACVTKLGVASGLFYVLTYVPIVFAAFLVVIVLGRDGDNPTKASLAGLYHRSPLLAVTLLVGMFGLAGIPPTAGFAGKWFLFSAAIDADLMWLVIVGAVNATVSLYYYVKIIKEAYLTPPADESTVALSPMTTLAAWCALVLVTVVGFWPRPVWEWAEAAATAAFGG